MSTIQCVTCGIDVETKSHNAKYCENCKLTVRSDYDKSLRERIKADTGWLERKRVTANLCSRRRYAANPEKQRKAQKKKYAKNPEYGRSYAKQWAKDNPLKSRINKINNKNKRRSRLKIPLPNKELLQQRLNLFGENICCYCNQHSDKIHIEHFLAVSKGGDNHLWNLYAACQRCNCSKGSKPFLKWFRKQPFYSLERELQILEYNTNIL